MKLSFLIVTKNRPDDLVFTLNKLKNLIDSSIHEVLVFIDGCAKTEAVIDGFNWVNWTVSKESISASPARNILYKKAKGTIFIGLDDDAHPISNDFITNVVSEFDENQNLGIIAFQEIRGLFKSDIEALKLAKPSPSFFTNDFVGCGFAIKNEVYNATNGFPIWMDIYGEESALAIEVLDLGFDIKYNNNIIVNHRVDVEKRKLQGRNYFRFEKQLVNSIKYYLIYHKYPMIKILKLLSHNFKKYALSDISYFRLFFKAIFTVFFNLFTVLKYRKPVKKSTLNKKVSFQLLPY
ncbi:glycosyltransferase family 2 protein [Mariniflexile gromovii]|uniref:Glycosyltransferase family 2 protein n=1 Tax=Mariniflexile gromovii TaxID=362523 RepID=A0ABS4BVY8_9FLAO|nr:glycosyltransferase [Mariniflexile gromovii]MBP0904528.1 glycosyltransferase family 2 protein [Mariniflexile gromovii]